MKISLHTQAPTYEELDKAYTDLAIKLMCAERILNIYANGCNGSLYFVNSQKEDEYRQIARNYFNKGTE